MVTPLRIASMLCSTLAVVFLACAGASLLGTTHVGDAPGAFRTQVEAASFGSKVSGGGLRVPVSVINQTGGPVRIVGATSICGASGCLSMADVLPRELAPGKNVIEVDVRTGQVGDYDQSITLYTDWEARPRLIVRVTGQIIAESGLPAMTGDSHEQEPAIMRRSQ